MQKNYSTSQNGGTLVGVGIGPANLSLAALLTNKQHAFNFHFFEQKPAFSWHAGLLLPDVYLQTSYLEDLVTTVDPTNQFSFISFLSNQKRLYRFIYANFYRILRTEFNEYLVWVSQSIPELQYGERVEDIQFIDNQFFLTTSKREINAQHIVLGSGIKPFIPSFAKRHIGAKVFHSDSFLYQDINFSDKRVAVIGGGQSSAEIINLLISNSNQLPSQLYWISRREQFSQLDESPFIYELFSPTFMNYFYDLDHLQKHVLLKKYSTANDGITKSTLEQIYQRLYRLELVEKRTDFFHAWTNHRLIDLRDEKNGSTLTIKKHASHDLVLQEVDIVILCTGYERPFPEYLSSLRQKIHFNDDQICVNKDFSIVWDGPLENRIYLQNAARHTHGLADTSLCLLAWRSANIINSVTQKIIYDVDAESVAINWKDNKENITDEFNTFAQERF